MAVVHRAVTLSRKLWENEQGGQRKDFFPRDLKGREELVRGTAGKTAPSWRQKNNQGLKV